MSDKKTLQIHHNFRIFINQYFNINRTTSESLLIIHGVSNKAINISHAVQIEYKYSKQQFSFFLFSDKYSNIFPFPSNNFPTSPKFQSNIQNHLPKNSLSSKQQQQQQNSETMSFRKIKSKSSKTLILTQPIRKQTHETLNQLEHEKRKYFFTEIEESTLINQIQERKKQLNRLKSKQITTQFDQKKSIITNYKLLNTDRTYENKLGNIEKIKQQINKLRKSILQYKQINLELHDKNCTLLDRKNELFFIIGNKYKQKQLTKQEIVSYRQLNIKNQDQFKKSFAVLTKSTLRQENQRKKMAVTGKISSGEQKKTVKSFQGVQSQLHPSQTKIDMKSDSIPIAKNRVNMVIHQNRQKLKILQNYMKFIQSLEYLFTQMKQYKGKQDIPDLTDQFVKKEKQIQKLVQYIGKLQYQIVTSKRELNTKKYDDDQLQKQLKINNQQQKQIYYQSINQYVKEDINKLEKQNKVIQQWFIKVGEVLGSLTPEQDFSRNNMINVIGMIQQKLKIQRQSPVIKKQGSLKKQHSALNVQLDDHYQKSSEILSYQKMKQFADEYLKYKKM